MHWEVQHVLEPIQSVRVGPGPGAARRPRRGPGEPDQRDLRPCRLHQGRHHPDHVDTGPDDGHLRLPLGAGVPLRRDQDPARHPALRYGHLQRRRLRRPGDGVLQPGLHHHLPVRAVLGVPDLLRLLRGVADHVDGHLQRLRLLLLVQLHDLPSRQRRRVEPQRQAAGHLRPRSHLPRLRPRRHVLPRRRRRLLPAQRDPRVWRRGMLHQRLRARTLLLRRDLGPALRPAGQRLLPRPQRRGGRLLRGRGLPADRAGEPLCLYHGHPPRRATPSSTRRRASTP